MMEIREFVAKFKNCRENEREKFIEKHTGSPEEVKACLYELRLAK